MEKLYQTAQERQVVLDWLYSCRTQADMSARYAISMAAIGAMRRNADGEYSRLMKVRVWNAIRQWKRAKSGNQEPTQIDLPGMPPTRRSILLEMIQKEMEAAGDDKLERFYKAIITA